MKNTYKNNLKYSQSVISKIVSILLFVFFGYILIQYIKIFTIGIFSIFVLICGVSLIVWSLLLIYDCFSYVIFENTYITIKHIFIKLRIDVSEISKYQFVKTNLFSNFSQGDILLIWNNKSSMRINIYDKRKEIEKILQAYNMHLTTASI